MKYSDTVQHVMSTVRLINVHQLKIKDGNSVGSEQMTQITKAVSFQTISRLLSDSD